VRARNVLSVFLNDRARNDYEFKRRCIEHSLYGVDIDPGAVEIAKLRLWLSLVVDEENIKNIKPLPNLDYKIVCGNSLLGVEKDLFNQQLFNDLEQLKPVYFNETNPTKKQEYKKQINDLINKITKGHTEFDFEVYFSEVFHNKGGFDVVIANPPYVSYGLRGGQKMSKEEKNFVRKNFPNSAEYKISLYAIFMDRGLQIAKPNGGIETYITPDSFLLGRYFSKVRTFILRTSEITNILLLPFNVFEATVGFSVVYLFQRKEEINPNHNLTTRFATSTKAVAYGEFSELTYPQKLFYTIKHNRFRLFFSKKIMKLVSIIEMDSDELGNFLTGRTGVRSLIGQKKIVANEKKGAFWHRGIISGSQIVKYKVIDKGNYINIDPKLLNKGGWDFDVIHNPKILVRQTGDKLIAAIDYDGFYHLNNVHSFAPNTRNNGRLDILYLLGIFNSGLLNFYYKNISMETGRAMAQTDIETLETLPVKVVPQQDQAPLIILVDKILAITKDDNYLQDPQKQAKVKELEREIDQMVYELYGLTDEEIRIVEGEGK